MTPSLLDSYQDLYQIPIETLDLSEKAVRVLKWHGIINLNLCVQFYILHARNRAPSAARLSPFMYGEVAPRLKALGYWAYVLDADVWQDLQRRFFLLKGKIVLWQGQNLDLYSVPLEHLGLPESTIEGLRSRNLTHLANAVEYFVRKLNRFRHSSPGPGTDLAAIDPMDLRFLDELEQALRDKGYWRFVDENFLMIDDIRGLP